MFYRIHWNNSQCSIQPAVIYDKNVSNVFQEKSFGFISEDLKHDTAFVYKVISKVCEYVKWSYQHITKVRHFSNGCAAQHKNYKDFLTLPPLQWFWFESRMGFLCDQSWKICCWWDRRDNKAIKGALSDLRQFLVNESPLKMMENAFYFTPKALFILKIFTFLSSLFGHLAKRLDKKDKVYFKFYDVIAWLANNCNTNIAQYFEK